MVFSDLKEHGHGEIELTILLIIIARKEDVSYNFFPFI